MVHLKIDAWKWTRSLFLILDEREVIEDFRRGNRESVAESLALWSN